ILQTVTDHPVEVIKIHSLPSWWGAIGNKHEQIYIYLGTLVPEPFSTELCMLKVYRCKDSLKEDLQGSALIISHADAKRCLEVVEKGKLPEVILNEEPAWCHHLKFTKQLHTHTHTKKKKKKKKEAKKRSCRTL
uniref:UDP-N-acetylglucosamine transferase subunit ALG13 n=1 Tax=Spermophilus dauricus TaxID=99837 RepID=A0A8C9Q722_SPEDA